MFLTRTSMCKWLKVYFLKHIESSHYSFIIIHEKHVTNGIVCDWVNWVYGCLWNKIRPQENTNQHIPKWGHRECLVDHQADWCWLGIINPFFWGSNSCGVIVPTKPQPGKSNDNKPWSNRFFLSPPLNPSEILAGNPQKRVCKMNFRIWKWQCWRSVSVLAGGTGFITR